MYNSFASERLIKLIDYKLKRYNELAAANPESPALKYINGEIELLRDTILPIVMENSTIGYREIQGFVTTSMKKLERHPLAKRTNDILFHLHLKDSGTENPIAAFFSNMRESDTIAIDLSINQKSEQIVPVYFSQPTFYRLDKE